MQPVNVYSIRKGGTHVHVTLRELQKEHITKNIFKRYVSQPGITPGFITANFIHVDVNVYVSYPGILTYVFIKAHAITCNI